MDDLDTDQIEANNKLFDLIRNKKMSEDEKLEKLKSLLGDFPAPNVNAKDGNDNDNTPLHLAVHRHLFKIVKFLRHKEANITIKNRNGKTSLEIAEDVRRHSLQSESSQISALNENTIQNIEKYVVKFDYRNFEDWDNIQRKKVQSKFKILKIDNLTEEQALQFMQGESFINFFNGSTHLFLFVIEVEGKLEITKSALRPLENILDTRKPIITQWESVDSSDIRILFKEPLGTFVQLNEDWGDLLTESQLIEEITPGNKLRFPLLLKALHFGLAGTFKGNLLETNFDVKCKIGTWRLIDYAAMSDDSLSLRFLLLVEWNLEELNNDNRRVLEIAAQYASPQSLAALLDLPITSEPSELQSSCQWKLLEVKDFQGRTLIEINIENGKVETLKFLIKCHVERDYKSLIQLAWNERKYDKMLALFEAAECPFPEEFRLEEVNYGELKEIVQEREDFHQAVQQNSHDKVEQYIETYPQLKIAYNLDNHSALNTALNAEQFEIYDLLERKGFEFGERECNLLTEKQQGELKKVRRKNFVKLDKYLIEFLLSKSKLAHKKNHFEHTEGLSQYDEDHFRKIKELYECLNDIPYVSTVLKVLEQSHIQEIIFDFNHDSVMCIDPTKPSLALDYCDHVKGCIYIAAKRQQEELLGTLAHECTHFAVQTVYKNECNPYEAIDQRTKAVFKRILDCYEKCEKTDMDSMVSNVFRVYPYDQWPPELIVCVNHLLAYYGNDEIELSKVKEKYKELFEFYGERVHTTFVNFLEQQACFRHQRLNDLLQRMNEIKQYHIRLNPTCLLGHKISSSMNNTMLISALPQLLKVDLYQSLLLIMDVSSIKARYICTTLNDFKNQAKVSEIRKSLRSDIEQTLVVDCSCVDNLSEIKLSDTITDFEKVIFIAHITKAAELQRNNRKGIQVERIERNYVWSDLSFESQELILEKTVDFQGHKVALNELITPDSHHAKQLPLEYLLSDKEIRIGRPVSTSENGVGVCYIGRNFNINDFQYKCSEEEMLEELANDEVILISGKPGLGKSSLLIRLSKLMKEKDPTFWVGRFELRYFSDLFENKGSKSKDFSVIEFLSKILLQAEDPLEKLLFNELLARKKVILMLDGLDEISSHHNEVFLPLLTDLKKSTLGQLWLTSRPQPKNSLLNELAVTSCELYPFFKQDQFNFLIEFAKAKRGITGDVAIIEHKARMCHVGLLLLVGVDFLSVPLHIRMLAETFDIENDGGTLLGKLNTVNLHRCVMKIKFNVYLYDKQEDDVDSRVFNEISFQELHERLAFQFLFPKEMDLFPFQAHRLEPEEIGRMGIAGEDLNFDNRTYAEYFVGTCFARQLVNPNFQPSFVHTFCMNEVLINPEYKTIRTFIDGVLESSTCSKETYEWHGKLLHTSNANILYVAASEGKSNIVHFLLRCLIVARRTHIFESFFKYEHGKRTSWLIAAENDKTNVLNVMWENYGEVCRNQVDDLKQLLLSQVNGDCACSLAIWYGQGDVLDWLLERGKELNLSPMEFTPNCRTPRLSEVYMDQILHMESMLKIKKRYTNLVYLKIKPFYKNILHLAASNNHWNIFELILEWFKHIELPARCVQNIFHSRNFDGKTLWYYLLDNSDARSALSKLWQCAIDKGVNQTEFKLMRYDLYDEE